MALLGFNVVVSLIAASILQKILPRFSLGRYLLCCRRLFRYLHPTNYQLKEILGRGGTAVPNATKVTKRRKHDTKQTSSVEEESFQVPRNIEVTLESAPVVPIDVLQLPFYVEYRWLIDFSAIALVVYCVTEAFNTCFPRLAASDVNLSVVWCLLVLAVCLKSLASVCALYFRKTDSTSKDNSERSLCLMFAVIFFLVTSLMLLLSDDILELGLLKAYENFTANAADYLKMQEIEVTSIRSPVLLYLCISLLYGFIAALLFFPCLRYAKMYLDALKYASETMLLKTLLHTTFVAPLMALILWIKPLARDQLAISMPQLLESGQFESLRIWCVILCVLLRLLTVWPCLQAYLNLAYARVQNLKKEAGRINNLELQRMIARIFFYLCVAAIQYFCPILLMLVLSLLLKTLGQYSWLAAFGLSTDSISFLKFDIGSSQANATSSDFIAGLASKRSLANISQLFNVTVHRGIFSFLLFWTTFVVFSLNAVGVFYYSQFEEF